MHFPKAGPRSRAILRRVLLVWLLLGSAPAASAGAEIRLVVFLVVDQFPFEMWERFRPLFRHGLADLAASGVVFENMHHEHACTETAPGHATLATGVHPARSGIVGNDWYDRRTDSVVYCLPKGPDGPSPEKLLRSALPDWLKDRSKDSRAFSVSGKDRAAVLLGGQRPDAAYWYSTQTGRMTTSRYYLPEPPAWVRRFHDRRPLDAYFGRPWCPLPVDEADRRRAGLVALDTGDIPDRFPHPLGGLSFAPDRAFFSSLYESPFLDAYTLAFARELAVEERLGQDSEPDLLAVSLSALDLVGHRYGPHSEEALDTVLRIDRWLGEFLAFLRGRVGEDRMLIVLTSDHGVQPIPEVRSKTGNPAARLGAQDIACVQRVSETVRARYGGEPWFLEGLYLNRRLVQERGLDMEDFERTVAQGLEDCPEVERVWPARDLGGPDPASSPERTRFRHCRHPERSPDFFLQLEPYRLASTCCRTEHGSCRDYDSHVPWVIRMPGRKAGAVRERTASVDVAPTIASLLGVAFPKDVDGIDRSALLDRVGP